MEQIALKSIELQNYRQFKTCKIDFHIDSKKPFNIIEGKNGFGKSNLLNAITWCFYGKEEHLKTTDKREAEPIPNTKVIKDLKEGQRSSTYVSVILLIANNDILIKRELWFGKRNGQFYQDNDSNFTILEQTKKGDWDKHPYPTYKINQILPEVVTKFFFFDGEQLRKFFEEINPEKVKKSIFDISQLFLIDFAIENLSKILSEYRIPNKDLEPILIEIKNYIDFYEKNIPLQDEEIKKCDQEIAIAKSNISTIDNEMKLSNIELVKELVNERDNLNEDVKKLNKELANLENDINNFVFDNVSPILSKNAIMNTSKCLSNLSLEGTLPPKIEDTFIRDLLDVKKRCICGTDLSSGKAREELKRMLEERKIKEGVISDANDLRYKLINYNKIIQNFNKKIESFIEAKSKKEEEIDKKEGKLKEISAKLEKFGNLKNEDINKKEIERKKYNEAIEERNRNIGIFKATKELYIKEQKEKEIEYDKKEKEKSKNSELISKKEFVVKGKRILEEIKEKLMSELREEIEENAKTFFSKMVTAKSFDDLKIDNDYNIILLKQDYNALKSLSVGETLLLALAFMGALRKVSGFAAPVIIDTPLASIDEEYRENLLLFMTEALDDTQIILLLKDTEYTTNVKNRLNLKTNIKKLLVYDRLTGFSDVKDYE